MLTELPYDRDAAVDYAKEWAFKRNPAYLDFENMGGDCTNFASQCVFAGSRVMNYTPVYGWYYSNGNHRTASWSGVPFFYNFMVGNTGVGPYAQPTEAARLEPGDLIQLGSADGRFYHTPIVVAVAPDEIYVAAHTFDAYMRPLSSYGYDTARYLHILGVRKEI